MAKKSHEAVLPVRSSEESGSTASYQSSEEEALPAPLSPPAADKDSADSKSAGSGSDSDDFERPLKTMAPKPADDGSRMKRPRSRPNSKPNLAESPLKTPTKRAAAAKGEKVSKKAKTEKGARGGEEEEKKSVLFQRLWGDDDEVAILEGMIEYKEKKGVDPMTDANDFHEFIKDSVHINVDRRQVVDKVRRLKKRYQNSSLKKKVSTNPHEKKIVELSKKVWGQKMEGEDPDQEIQYKVAANASAQNGETELPARKKSSSSAYNGKKEAGNSGEFDKVQSSVQFLGKATVSMGLSETVVNAGLELCSEDKKAELEENWKKLHLEETDLFLRKLELARQEGEMITAALRSVGK